jgi:uncharacterized protein
VKLRLSPDVTLPMDAVTQTFAVLGKRGSGKTNTAGVLTEQLIKAGLPVVYVDPIGVTWGLRHSRDGKSPGLPVIILGGEHADVPLEETGGVVIADFVIEHRQPVVLDLGLFSKGAQRRFMVDFAERLYLKNRDALHVMLDEVDTFCPQRIEHGGERLVGAINDLVRKGRARGLGVTLISQRPALVNKDVLTQVETLIAHRMTGPQDRDAIERWIEHNADKQEFTSDAVLASLQTLDDGDAWVWSPSWLKKLVRTHINLRETFDSSATPKAGARVTTPKHAAEVDLGALRDQLAATIEKAKADDPRELKRRIAELERQVKIAPASQREVPALSKEQEQVLVGLRREVVGLQDHISELETQTRYVAEDARRLVGLHEDVKEGALKTAARVEELASIATRLYVPPSKTNGAPARKPVTAAHHPLVVGAGEPMPGGHRRILLALARYGACGKDKLAILARYAANGGGFNNYLGALRTVGHVAGGDVLNITEAGLLALGSFDPLPEDPEALFADWMRHPDLGRAHRAILQALKAREHAMTKEDLAARCDPPYEPAGGGFNNALSRLRTLGVIEGKTDIQLAEQLR